MERQESFYRKIRILVTDRNHHVRRFLLRELAREGYDVTEASGYQEMYRLLDSRSSFHLLIFDPDIAHGSALESVRLLKERHPELVVIIHSYCDEAEPLAEIAAAVIAKKGPIEELKAAVTKALAPRSCPTFGKFNSCCSEKSSSQ